MSSTSLNEIIRTEFDVFKTPNIIEVLEGARVRISNENFRKNTKATELFLFFCYQQKLYYPIWFEFRSINNNVLFLIEEFGIESFNLLQKILNSSLKKEEGWVTDMRAIVFHTLSPPPFSHLLKKFSIETHYRIDIYDKA